MRLVESLPLLRVYSQTFSPFAQRADFESVLALQVGDKSCHEERFVCDLRRSSTS